MRLQQDRARHEASEQKDEWVGYGRELTQHHDNRGARASRELVRAAKVENGRTRQLERGAARVARMQEMQERAASNRRRAESLRQQTAEALQRVSESEIRSRQRGVDEMRSAEELRRLDRYDDKRLALAETRESHDSVLVRRRGPGQRARPELRGRRLFGPRHPPSPLHPLPSTLSPPPSPLHAYGRYSVGRSGCARCARRSTRDAAPPRPRCARSSPR